MGRHTEDEHEKMQNKVTGLVYFSNEALRRGKALKTAEFPGSSDACLGFSACSIQKHLVGTDQPGSGTLFTA